MQKQDFDTFESYLRRNSFDLKPYQVEGVAWTLQRERNGIMVEGDPSSEKTRSLVKGGILADEMGLGKTIQMISTILCNPLKQTLIVLPRALMEQWHRAIYETTGHDALIFHGPRRTSRREDLERCPIVITTYSLVAGKKQKKNSRP